VKLANSTNHHEVTIAATSAAAAATRAIDANGRPIRIPARNGTGANGSAIY
jgi:hypothetical protein